MVTGLINGQPQVGFEFPFMVAQGVQADRIRSLAIAGPKRVTLLPAVPKTVSRVLRAGPRGAATLYRRARRVMRCWCYTVKSSTPSTFLTSSSSPGCEEQRWRATRLMSLPNLSPPNGYARKKSSRRLRLRSNRFPEHLRPLISQAPESTPDKWLHASSSHRADGCFGPNED